MAVTEQQLTTPAVLVTVAERVMFWAEGLKLAEAFAAVMVTPELRDSYLTIARHWRDMASQLEKSAHAEQTEATEGHLSVKPDEDTK